jgi:hypothetical protein
MGTMPDPAHGRYRSIRFGVDTLEAGLVLPRHRHTVGYATVVLAGTFEEASFAGRFMAGPGDAVRRVSDDIRVPIADELAV